MAAVGGAWYGAVIDEQARARAARECKAERDAARVALAQNDFDGARRHISSAGESCTGSAKRELRQLESDGSAKEEAQRKADAEARARRQVQDFIGQVPRVSKQVQSASSLASASKWTEATAALDAADAAMHPYATSRATETKEWKDLTASIGNERARIAPGLAKIEADRRVRQEAEQAAADRKRKAEEAASAAREASRRVKCCDDTLSPSCLCSRDSMRGCCSHHGGVCGCED